MHAGGAVFWFCFVIAFVITTIVVIVLVLLDWCNRFARTETTCAALQLWQVNTGSPPGNNVTVQDVLAGDDPEANVAWIRNGSLVWMGFDIQFPLQILPCTGVAHNMTFQTLVLEFTSNCMPRPRYITRESSLFKSVGSCFLDEGNPESPSSVEELMCEIDLKRRPGTTIVVVAKDITLNVDANGSAFVSVSGNIVFPPQSWAVCCSSQCCQDGGRGEQRRYNHRHDD